MTSAIQPAYRTPRPSGLADVLDLVLDKGIVVDAYVRLSLIGIEILTLDARIVIASVDTYLRFAEAVNRLDLQPHEQVSGLPGLVDDLREGGGRRRTRGAMSGIREGARELKEAVTSGGDDQKSDEQESGERQRQPAKRSSGRGQRPTRRSRAREEGEDDNEGA